MSCKHGNWPPCDECDELDAAYKSGYEHGGKVSIDLTLKHLKRAEKAEAELKRIKELLRGPSAVKAVVLTDQGERLVVYFGNQLLAQVEREMRHGN